MANIKAKVGEDNQIFVIILFLLLKNENKDTH